MVCPVLLSFQDALLRPAHREAVRSAQHHKRRVELLPSSTCAPQVREDMNPKKYLLGESVQHTYRLRRL